MWLAGCRRRPLAPVLQCSPLHPTLHLHRMPMPMCMRSTCQLALPLAWSSPLAPARRSTMPHCQGPPCPSSSLGAQNMLLLLLLLLLPPLA